MKTNALLQKKKPFYTVGGVLLLLSLLALALLPVVKGESLGSFPIDQEMSLIQTCDNCSICSVTSLYYPNGSYSPINSAMSKSGSFFSFSLANTYLQNNGFYAYCYECESSGQNASDCVSFKITPNGENPTIANAVFYIGLLGVLIVFFILCIYAFVTFDNLLNRVGMLGLGYLLLMAITFVGWNMANDFLTSSPFIADMLRILFFVLIAGLFPLVIGGFAWYVIMIVRIKEIQNLMEHGMSLDEAERRTGRRR